MNIINHRYSYQEEETEEVQDQSQNYDELKEE